MGQRGKRVTVVITPEKSQLWGNLREFNMCFEKKIIENLESQWGKRDIKPHSNWIGIKSRPVRAITAVKLKLSGTVSHCVHTLVLLEAFKGGANHCYLKTQPLLYPPPTHSNHQMIEKMYNNYTLCTFVLWLSGRARKETAQVLFCERDAEQSFSGMIRYALEARKWTESII